MLEQGNEKFEMDSLAVLEKLLQGYKRAKESNVWESNIDELVEKMTQFPTEPFALKLMSIFDYDYVVNSENIYSIIEKSLTIREQMKHTERFVTIDEKYFTLPFLPPETHLKKLEIFNSNGELCYAEKGKIRINIGKLLLWVFFRKKRLKPNDIFFVKHQTKEIQQLEIFYYSEYLNLSTTDRKAYYNFFCDYYGKLKFLNYIRTNSHIADNKPKTTDAKAINDFSSFRQVVWANFIFNLIGLRLRENLDRSSFTKFLLLINNLSLDEYKNTYYYKLAGKLHNLSSKKYFQELEFMKNYFQERNFPTTDIDRVMKKMKRK
jgi:hypothetical protein